MKTSSRIIILIAALLMLLAYFFPLWDIRLEAPQYPEGLGLQIWINKLGGDLNIINGLNHYIGMKEIEPATFSELLLMPYLVAALMACGLLVFFTNSRKWLLAWVLLLVAAGITGAVDFYQWEYNYGHDLDPHAAIKIPGMSYQPPLMGTKQLLNFTAHSYPHVGGWVIIITGLLAMLALWNEYRGQKAVSKVKPVLKYAALLFTLFVVSSCSIKPEPISYGQDACNFCRMKIIDNRFGAECVTGKGKVYKFDSIECMVKFLENYPAEAQKNNLLLVTNYHTEGELMDASAGTYLINESIPSPMGMNVSAHSDKKDIENMLASDEGQIMGWEELKTYLAQQQY